MPEALSILMIAVAIIMMFIGAVKLSYHQRCADVYQGPQLEMCIKRLSEDGPLYEKNIGKF